MDLITPEAVPVYFSFVAVLIGTIFFLVVAWFCNHRSEKSEPRNNAWAYGFHISLGLALIWITASGIVWQIAQSSARDELDNDRAAWVESHDVTTQNSTVADLEFPSEKPDGDTKFGIAQVIADDNSIVNVHLAWEDGEFVLYGTDGQPLERLED